MEELEVNTMVSNLSSHQQYNKNKRKNTMIVTIVLLIVSAVVTISISITAAAAIAITTNVNTKSATKLPTITVIRAGRGNSSSVLTQFVPNRIMIKTGDSIIWNNPTAVAEPHTVTFVNDNRSMAELDIPFAISNGITKFMPMPPGSNGEPILMPNIPQEQQIRHLDQPQSRTVITTRKSNTIKYYNCIKCQSIPANYNRFRG
jgi:plastocyanin